MNSQNKKTLQVVLIALIAVVTLGIGYASITAINLIINGNATATVDQNNFKVKFLSEQGVTPTIEGAPTNTISVDSDTTASFSISSLDGAGQSVTATYKVKNVSAGIGATIGLQLTSSNTEYFKVTEKILDDTLQAGEETTVTVKVEMLKTPMDTAVTTTVTATLTATPLENASATGGDEQEVVKPASYVYTFHKYDGTYMNINEPIPQSERTYSNFPAAKEGFGHPGAVAHIVAGGKIKESYVVYEKDNKVYYLKGGIIEAGKATKPVYDENVSKIKEMFGSNWESVCQEYETTCGEDCIQFECSVNQLNVSTNVYGRAYLQVPGWYCGVELGGGAACNG